MSGMVGGTTGNASPMRDRHLALSAARLERVLDGGRVACAESYIDGSRETVCRVAARQVLHTLTARLLTLRYRKL